MDLRSGEQYNVQRGVLRGSLDGFLKQAKNQLEKDEDKVDIETLEDLRSQIDECRSQLLTCDQHVCAEITDDQQLKKELEKSETYRTKIVSTLTRLDRRITQHNRREDDERTTSSRRHRNMQSKLPKLGVPSTNLQW